MAKTKYALAVARIGDELQAHIELAQWLRATLQGELYSAVGNDPTDPSKGRRGGIDKASVDKYAAAVGAFEKLTKCKIQLDKNAKDLADNMTTEDEREAVTAYVKAMDPKERTLWLAEMNAWHSKSP